MPTQTKTTITPAGKVKIKAAIRAAPMLPTLRTSATYAAMPSVTPTSKKRRRAKKSGRAQPSSPRRCKGSSQPYSFSEGPTLRFATLFGLCPVAKSPASYLEVVVG
jgi:hypothetical protein